MADILLTCPHCSKTTTVSEYAAGPTIPCPACGAAIPLPATQKRSRLTLRKLESPPPEAGPPPIPGGPSVEDRKNSAFLKRDLKRVQRDKWINRSSWLVFLALTAVLFYLRFQGGYAQWTTLEELKFYGMTAIGAMYLIIIICALKDNMFDGLLALVVPLYPFYYIFTVSSAVFLRALTAALLVVFGRDLAELLQTWLTMLFNVINYWIRNA